MLKRTIVISTPRKLRVADNQLCILSNDEKLISKIPIEDLLCLIIENQQVYITIPTINALLENNVCISICNNKGMPAGLLYPLASNTLQGERYRIQLNATGPVESKSKCKIFALTGPIFLRLET